MNKNLWDGEMDVGLEDLGIKIKETTAIFTEKMLNLASVSSNAEAQALISEVTMDRFQSLAELLAVQIQDGFYFGCEDIENINDNASKLNCWIILGTLTETSLQIYLTFYIDKYRSSKWQQWEGFETKADLVKTTIAGTINELVKNGTITSKQGNSFKDAIKETIKEHTKEHPVQRVMLDELVQYYSTNQILDEDEIFYIKSIQESRNGIHSFEDRGLGTWTDLQYSTRFWCYLLEWIMDKT